jgi:hypothetical protein
MAVTQPDSPDKGSSRAPSATHTRIGRFRFSAVELLIALVLFFFLTPFLEDLKLGDIIDGALMGLVLVASVLAVGGRRRSLLAMALLMSPALVARVVNVFRPDLVPHWAFLVLALVFLLVVVVRLFRFILTAVRVNGEVLCASIANLLILGLLWAFAYELVAQVNPQAFLFNSPPGVEPTMTRMNAIYFSFVSLSTVGYGDIVPVSGVARMLANMESMTGMLYVAVLIARLVALYSSSRPTGGGTQE